MYLKSLKFRFTIVFSVVFIAGATGLYAVSYILVSTFLQQEERRLRDSKLLEFWAVYRMGRVAAVQREFTPENLVSEATAFFIRIANRENRTLLLFRPASWREYDLEVLDGQIHADDEEFVSLSIDGADGSVLSVASVVLFDGNFLQVGVSNRQRVALLDNLLRVYLLVSVPLVVLGIIGGWLVASRGLRPVKRLSTLSRFIIETGELSRRIPPRESGDELDELTRLFNQMLEKIETLVTGIRSSLDNVAHDLRTPMTRIRFKADSATRETTDPGSKEVFQAIVSETEQMLTMMTTLMDISGAETGVMRLELEELDFGRILSDIAELYTYAAAEKAIEVSTEIESRLPVLIDLNRMRQVVANLIDNAVKYTDPDGSVHIRAHLADGFVHVSVTDTGIGVESRDIPLIWNRLYRGDKSRSEPGLGLGLGLVKAIVEAHGGTVSASSPAPDSARTEASHPSPRAPQELRPSADVGRPEVSRPGSVFEFTIPSVRRAAVENDRAVANR